MPDVGRHFRLESENRGWILAVAAVFIVSSAWVTLVAQSNATHRLITDSAGKVYALTAQRMTCRHMFVQCCAFSMTQRSCI